jgi:hypothetical protein
MPVVFTTNQEDQNGTLLPALEPVLPEAYAGRIERDGTIDSLADPRVAEALAGTGRRRLITAGIGTEVCGLPAALHGRRDGHEVTFVADACGTQTATGHEIALRRLESEGIRLATTASITAEFAGDYARSRTSCSAVTPGRRRFGRSTGSSPRRRAPAPRCRRAGDHREGVSPCARRFGPGASVGDPPGHLARRAGRPRFLDIGRRSGDLTTFIVRCESIFAMPGTAPSPAVTNASKVSRSAVPTRTM